MPVYLICNCLISVVVSSQSFRAVRFRHVILNQCSFARWFQRNLSTPASYNFCLIFFSIFALFVQIQPLFICFASSYINMLKKWNSDKPFFQWEIIFVFLMGEIFIITHLIAGNVRPWKVYVCSHLFLNKETSIFWNHPGWGFLDPPRKTYGISQHCWSLEFGLLKFARQRAAERK